MIALTANDTGNLYWLIGWCTVIVVVFPIKAK
jgi:hypothetical protein